MIKLDFVADFIMIHIDNHSDTRATYELRMNRAENRDFMSLPVPPRWQLCRI